MVDRRVFCYAAAGAIASLPLTAQGQAAGKVARVGWLGTPWGMSTKTALDGFRSGMRDLGWVEGRNLAIEIRFGERDQAGALATELVHSKVDVIVTQGPMILGAKVETGAIPVVFAFSGDPIEAGLVASLARPGGHRTGVTAMALDLVGKRMELLKETLPALKRVAVLANPSHPGEQAELRESLVAARQLGVALQYLPVRSGADLEAAFEAMSRERAEAIVAFPDASINRHGKVIAEFAVRRRIPAISGFAEFAEDGNLMSYGPNFMQLWRRISSYADRILKGASPADLPVEQPTLFELVINLKTAKTLGIRIPQSVLLRADNLLE